VRHCSWYLNWKTGVEIKLSAFQLAQAQATASRATQVQVQTSSAIHHPSFGAHPTTTNQPVMPPWVSPHQPTTTSESVALVAVDTPVMATMPLGVQNGPSPLCAPSPPPDGAWMSPMIGQSDDHPGLENITPVPAPVIPRVSVARAFMNARPGGPVPTLDHDLQTVERRVSAHVQKKCMTSQESRTALASLSTTTAARNRMSAPAAVPRRGCTKTTTTQKLPTETKKRSKPTKPTRPSKNPPTTHLPPVAPEQSKPSCSYGCEHIGLVELAQMTPNYTRRYLDEDGYFGGKSCLDCHHSIAELFATSKQKAVFYYCQHDYNVFQLHDDSDDLAEKPCDCILCIACYFARDEKKNTAAGSRRVGRKRS
jgi:hypothetical protein